MKKLTLYVSIFWVLLPLQSETQNKSEHLYEQFNKISEQNWYNTGLEKKVSVDDIEAILDIIANIKTEDINKPINSFNETFLKICVEQTSHFPEAIAEKITKKVLEKGADMAYNPHAAYTYARINYELPLWSAALSGNVGAYNAMIVHADTEEIYLWHLYEGEILKLPHVVDIALKRLKIMELYYKAELQKVRSGKRKGCTYQYFNRVGSGISVTYEECTAVRNLETVVKSKKQFQKMQNINTQHYSENNNDTPEQESLIIEFLEERIPTFNEYKHSKIYRYVNGKKESLK